MGPLWPLSADPPDGVLVAAYSPRRLLEHWVPTTSCFLHLVSWRDPERARRQTVELVVTAGRWSRRDGAVDFWAVLRALIVEDLTFRLPDYLDGLVECDETIGDVVVALRATSTRDQLLLCMLDDSEAPRHEAGRFGADDLGRLFGIEPEHVYEAVRAARQTCQAIIGHHALDEGLEAIRPPARVGAEVFATPPPSTAPTQPPDPLGADDPEGPIERRRAAAGAARGRWLAGSVAGLLALVSVGTAIAVNSRDGGQSGQDAMADQATGATTSSTQPVEQGGVHAFEVSWGPNPGVCPDGQLACYSIAVELDGYTPERQLTVTCVVAQRASPGSRNVVIDGDGSASIHVPCVQDRTARTIGLTVDGADGVIIDLPTKIVPTPTVRFENDRPAGGQFECDGADCRYVDVVLAGFEPQRTVTVTCRGERARPLALTVDVKIGPDGIGTGEACIFGAAGERFLVVAGDVSSDTIVWPGDG